MKGTIYSHTKRKRKPGFVPNFRQKFMDKIPQNSGRRYQTIALILASREAITGSLALSTVNLIPLVTGFIFRLNFLFLARVRSLFFFIVNFFAMISDSFFFQWVQK
ncbi:MAG: hypothetical protein SF052_02725 [Bacteroidia bacterium]|nr:hypothetical protein [Bacteroidia bacterium]